MGQGSETTAVHPGRPRPSRSIPPAPLLPVLLAILVLAGAAVWAGGRPQGTPGPSSSEGVPSGGTATLTAETTPSSGPSATPIPLPADIAGKVWLVDREQLYLDPPRKGFVGGTLDGSIHEAFPVDWDVLAFDGSRVVTVDRQSGALTVSDRASSAAVLTVATGLDIQQVTLTEEALYWTGAADGGKADGGVWVQQFDGSAPKALVPAGPYPDDLSLPPVGQRPSPRTELLVSPSGKTLATALCDLTHCLTTVVDTAAGENRTLDLGGNDQPAYVTDDVVVLFRSPANDLPPAALTAFDKTTLKERWTISAWTVFYRERYLTSDGLGFIQAFDEAKPGQHDYRLERVTISDGSRTLLWRYLVDSAPQGVAIGALSSDRYVVLLPDQLEQALEQGDGITSFDVLDLVTGSLTDAAGYIDARGD